MTDQFTVDLQELEQIIARLSGLAGFIAEHLDEIDDKIATLRGTGWEGVAAQAYSEAHEQWIEGAREFTDGIRDMSDAAKSAHTAYTEAADTNTKMMRSGS
ncbi:WXG100 family type VII secretion target [Nocardia colli]|uniref:ESAT-6-like protein n=1 Tax=Nocardia colli TaxID=2545717 RepID=A0A5N0E6I8_9NOCA|nr:WXG100 family type VII secretion target [Nocardia colli]KAA8884300.1 WXG100 family type VII secretion target [Nocardia colli]